MAAPPMRAVRLVLQQRRRLRVAGARPTYEGRHRRQHRRRRWLARLRPKPLRVATPRQYTLHAVRQSRKSLQAATAMTQS